MKKKLLILIGLSLAIIALDLVTKTYVHTHFMLGESIPVIPGYFNFTYVRNPGAAFGFLAQSHPTFRETFFLIMPPIALVIILLILKTVKDDDLVQIIALSSVFGGAIGNYIDRLKYGYVVDFLDFHWQEKYTWPAFNIADSAIVCGVILLLILMFFEDKKKTALAKQ